jgi:prepilin-type N-terminal cleavage/methylation domain-containing protein
MSSPSTSFGSRAGFTLVELSIASAIMMAVTAGALSLFLVIQNSWTTADLHLRAASESSRALTRMVYGAGSDRVGIRQAFREQVSLEQALDGGWTLRLSTNVTETIQYRPDEGDIVTQSGFVIADNVVASTAALASGGCRIALTVRETGRRREAVSAMSTYVKFRNQHVLTE